MRKLYVIGIGTGGLEQLTLQAVRTLARLDAVFMLEKGSEKDDLLRLRREICAQHTRPDCRQLVAPDVVRDPTLGYETRVDAWHDERSRIYEAMFREGLAEHEQGGILVWGDPSLYDSTLRMLARIVERGELALSYDVIPGVSSVQALAASHRIALNRVGGPVHITTGRRLARGEANEHADVVVMLDGECAFQQVPDEGAQIFWGAYLGSEHEILLSGPLSELKDVIVRTREGARARHGWIMDIYLLRR